MNVYYSEIDNGIGAVFFVAASTKKEAADKMLAKVQLEGYNVDIEDIDPIEYSGEPLMFFLN